MQYPAEIALLAHLVAETTKQCYNDFVAADDYTRARMIGRVVGEVVIALVATKGAIKAISALKDTKLFTSLMSKLAKGEMAGKEAVATLEATAEAIESAEAAMEVEGTEASLANIVRDITGLQNTADFRAGALEHILEGEVNSSGKAVGFHYEGLPSAKGSVISGTESAPNSFGVYQAKLEVSGIAETSNGGMSTFFPKSMTPQKVIDCINEAFSNKVLLRGNTYMGTASNGMEVTMYIDSNGQIISAFPVYS